MRSSTFLRAAGAALLAVAAAACTDRDLAPTAAPALTPVPSMTVQYRCDANVLARTVQCAVPGPNAGGVRANVVMGGQNVFVKLRSSNVSAGGGTFSFDVSLQNLLAQPMGTTDGTTPDPGGTRIFFVSGPTATGGSGAVSVANADGTGSFTAASQPYFEYDGVIGPGATTSTKSWHLSYDAGVTSFAFALLVSAPMPKESGWVSISEPNPTLAPGQAVALTATVRNAEGSELTGQTVSWSSSAPGVATVDPSGNVQAVANGTTTITATAGARTGSTTVTVAPVDTTAPTLTGTAISPSTVNAGDSVTLTVSATDAGVGVAMVSASAFSPSFTTSTSCSASTPASGTVNSGTWACRFHIPPGAAAGTWQVFTISLTDRRQNQATTNLFLTPSFPHTFTVTDATPDNSPPSVTSLSLTPSSLNAGDSTTIAVGVTDTGTGVNSVIALAQGPGGNGSAFCSASAPASGTPNAGTYDCHMRFPVGARAGTWTLTSLYVTDKTGNNTSLSTAQLAGSGYPVSITVIDAAVDTTAPTLAGVSFTPTSPHTTDSVTVTITAADAGSGVSAVVATFRSPTLYQDVSCVAATPGTGTRAYGTFTCKLGFPSGAETGTWTLLNAVLIDVTGNSRTMDTGDLKALGYTTTMTVSP